MLCELCTRPTGDAYLCPACATDLSERLEQLPALLDQLADMLIPTPQADGGRRGSSAKSRPPLDLDVVARRYNFAALIAWHCAILDGTSRHRDARYGALDEQITGACIALRASVPWITYWPGAADLAYEVRDLYDDARSVVGAADLPARMGACPQLVHGTPCGAELLLPSGQQVLTCPWCGARFPPGTWGMLKVEQRKAAQAAAGAAAARPSHPSATVGSG